MKSKIIWIIVVVIILIIIGYLTRKYWLSFFKKTINGNKGTPPVGCGENQRGWFSDKSIPYYYQFNRPYYKFKKGDKVIGTCKRIPRGDFADTWDCGTIDFYYNGISQEVPSDVLDELDKVATPVVGFNDPDSDWRGCTKPFYDTSSMPNASEICFSSSDLGLKNGDTVPSTIRVAYRDLGTKTWHFNRVGGDNKYCYVYNPDGKYPTI